MLVPQLESGEFRYQMALSAAQMEALRPLQLLTPKPMLFVCHVDVQDAGSGNALSRRVEDLAASKGYSSIVISPRLEMEAAGFEDVRPRSDAPLPLPRLSHIRALLLGEGV